MDVCERELGELLDSLRTNEQIHVPQKRCSTPMDSPSPAHGATELPTPPEPAEPEPVLSAVSAPFAPAGDSDACPFCPSADCPPVCDASLESAEALLLG